MTPPDAPSSPAGPERRPVLPPGVALGALGVLAFSFSLPATRVAVGGLAPWFVALGRAAGAGLISLVLLRASGARRPSPRQLRRLLVVAAGVVLGFPVLTSLALRHVPASHGSVVVAVLPAATALMAMLLGGERPGRSFSLAAGAGLAAVLGFVVSGEGTGGGFGTADLELLGAVALCAVGYAEGGALARELGGARVICWATVLALPVTLPGAGLAAGHPHADLAQWSCFAYVTLVSSLLGFFAWYAGLARGGVARVGQVQLAQPILGLGWAALLLGEPVGAGELVCALAVLACVVGTQRARG